MLNISPMNLERLRKASLTGTGALCIWGRYDHRHATIDSFSKVGTGFWLVNFTINNEHLQVLLDSNGRDTTDGNFPFWEILDW